MLNSVPLLVSTFGFEEAEGGEEDPFSLICILWMIYQGRIPLMMRCDDAQFNVSVSVEATQEYGILMRQKEYVFSRFLVSRYLWL